MWLASVPWTNRSGPCPFSPCWRPPGAATRPGAAATRRLRTGPARCYVCCAAGCPTGSWWSLGPGPARPRGVRARRAVPVGRAGVRPRHSLDGEGAAAGKSSKTQDSHPKRVAVFVTVSTTLDGPGLYGSRPISGWPQVSNKASCNSYFSTVNCVVTRLVTATAAPSL